MTTRKKTEVPRMPDAPPEPPRAAPMPTRAKLPTVIDPDSPDAWWQSIIACMSTKEGHHLLRCQREFAANAWIAAHRPPEWTPPDEEARIEREAIQAEGCNG